MADQIQPDVSKMFEIIALKIMRHFQQGGPPAPLMSIRFEPQQTAENAAANGSGAGDAEDAQVAVETKKPAELVLPKALEDVLALKDQRVAEFDVDVDARGGLAADGGSQDGDFADVGDESDDEADNQINGNTNDKSSKQSKADKNKKKKRRKKQNKKLRQKLELERQQQLARRSEPREEPEEEAKAAGSDDEEQPAKEKESKRETRSSKKKKEREEKEKVKERNKSESNEEDVTIE